MSLSWLDRLSLFVHPQRIVLERQAWRGKVERFSLPVLPATADEADWQPALAGASALLAGQSTNGARLQIVIANAFVRYALLPWSATVIGDKARRAVAGALLKNSLGDQAEHYEIALDQAAFGRNGLAAAISRSLLEGLRQMAKSRRLRLTSLQPQLSHELSLRRQPLNDGCIAFADAGWLTLLGCHEGNYCLLRNHRTALETAAAHRELLSLLATEAATVNPKQLQIFTTSSWPGTLDDWQIDSHPPRFTEAAHA